MIIKAIVLKNISPLVKKDSILIKRGKFGILQGHDKREYIKNGNFKTPNFYPWNQIKSMPIWFKIERNAGRTTKR